MLRSNSGSSVDSLKVLQKDTTTRDYLVRMTPAEFNKFSNQNRSEQGGRLERFLYFALLHLQHDKQEC